MYIYIYIYVYIYIYIYIGYSKKVKNIFSKRFDVCLHQSILFTIFSLLYSHYYILSTIIYNKEIEEEKETEKNIL